MLQLLDFPFTVISWVSGAFGALADVRNSITGWEDDDDGVGRCVMDRRIGD